MSLFGLLLPFLQVVFHSVDPTISPSDIPHSCPSVTTLFVRNRCFWAINDINNFNQSQSRCLDNGGILGEIPDQQVEEAVIKEFGTNWLWIGVNKRPKNTMFNMFNEIVNYTHWTEGEPSRKITDACVVLTNQGWRLVRCSLTTQALCSRRLRGTIRDCECPCERTKHQVVITDSRVLQAKIKSIQQELSIKKRSLSGSLRMKTSANDGRISSAVIGVSSGLILTIIIISSTILSDIFPRHCQHTKIS